MESHVIEYKFGKIRQGKYCSFWLAVCASKVLGTGTSLVVQWLRPCASTAEDMGLIPGQRTKILHVMWHSHKKSVGTNS